MTKPTKEHVERALATLASRMHFRIFYEGLNNPEWITALREAGEFQHPEEPYSVGSGTAYPHWPQSQYLARMAKVAPKDVADILCGLRTSNSHILLDMTRAACDMPGCEAARVSTQLCTLLRADPWPIFSTEFAGLIQHLVGTGEVKASLDLAETVFWLAPPAKRMGYRTRIDEYWYRESLHLVVRPLAGADGASTCRWLRNLLSRAIRIRFTSHEYSGDPRSDDLSLTWRTVIREHEQNRSDDIDGAIVLELRNAYALRIQGDALDVAEAVAELEAERFLIFKRIAMDLLVEYGHQAPEIVRARLTDRALFGNTRFRHEYVSLLRSAFSSILEPDNQTLILGWIGEGPDRDAYKNRCKALDGTDVTDEQISKYVSNWTRERLEWIGRENLSGEWASKLDSLSQELGEMPHPPEFAVWSQSRWGWESPKSAEELMGMPVDDMLSYLHDWREKPGDPFGPELEGLIHIFGAVAKERLEDLLPVADRFSDLAPGYARGVLDAVIARIKEDNEIDLDSILDLCEWVVQQQDGPPDQEEQKREPTRWQWTRDKIRDLIEAACDARVDQQYSDQFWRMLKILTWDSTRDYLVENPPEDFYWYALTNRCINSPRSEAVHALVRFAVWKKVACVGESSGQIQEVGFEIMPEVRDELEAHLDPSQEQSETVRAMYGYVLPTLGYLDPDWLGEKIEQIAPLTGDDACLGWAAWSTYLDSNHVWSGVYDRIASKYEESIAYVSKAAESTESDRHPALSLGAHLSFAYAWRKFELDNGKSPIEEYLIKAPAWLRGKMMSHLGQMFRSEEDHEKMGEAVIDRYRALWDFYVDGCITKDGRQPEGVEVDGFGRWFSWAPMDEDWLMRRLRQVLSIDAGIELEFAVMERLAKLGSSHPDQTVECADMMVRRDAASTDRWRLHRYKDDLHKLLDVVLEQGGGASAQIAMSVVHSMSRQGYMEFEDLYNKYSGEQESSGGQEPD